jgi:hypothetical protein
MEPRVINIFICPTAGEPMQRVPSVRAIAGAGLEGDRYAIGAGSFNKGEENRGKRQVTLIHARFFERSTFKPIESRRNILVDNMELMWTIGREFRLGAALIRGVKYCDPCDRVSRLANKRASFKLEFQDCGGLIAEIVEGGLIIPGDSIILPPKGY